ncbi:class I SAM-dependent methyltransferase [Halobacteria archaeon AArc-m2/3/4]|uniref:Class I SAM-dependent methyltransferase n=1 Tax=Natronoglomus mannanivorans TaxID=2979990 RepID=A0AAP2Z0V0_9EURY|nr:class I SAM-dependent methyltransferase [Halobacteria archaeon AArc-xg1-1]MCU4972867.1 class I SAM-dependent methyltransferase [Halobacteria archaeon AArc-m2/3/4]
MAESQSTSRSGREEISHPIFASLYDHVPDERFLKPHRDYLTADLSGRILDLGAGTGALFPHVLEAVGGRSVTEYHAVEPDPHMRRRAERRAVDLDLAVDVRDGRAESLPYPDDAFDYVLASVVFCTIADPDAALDEVARVLKPGGEFRFLEHVHADGWRARAQDVLNPLWARTAGGCQLNRETTERFVGHDSFDVLEVERLSIGVFPAAPFVRGRLQRRRSE